MDMNKTQSKRELFYSTIMFISEKEKNGPIKKLAAQATAIENMGKEVTGDLSVWLDDTFTIYEIINASFDNYYDIISKYISYITNDKASTLIKNGIPEDIKFINDLAKLDQLEHTAGIVKETKQEAIYKQILICINSYIKYINKFGGNK